MSVTFSLKDALLPQDVIDIVEFFYNHKNFKQFHDKILLKNMLNKIDELPDEEKKVIKDQLKRVEEKLNHNYLSYHYNYQFQRKWDIKSVRVSKKEEKSQGYLFQQELIPQEIKVLARERKELAEVTSIEAIKFPGSLKEKIRKYAANHHKNFTTYDVLFAFNLSEIDDELLDNFIFKFEVQNNQVFIVPAKKIEEQLQISNQPPIKSASPPILLKDEVVKPPEKELPKAEALTLQERCTHGEKAFTQNETLSDMAKYFAQMKKLVSEVEREAKNKKVFVKELEEITKAFYEQWSEKSPEFKKHNQNLKESFVNLHVDVLKEINDLKETLTAEDMRKTMNISSLRKFSLYKQAPSSLSNKEIISKLCKDEIKKLETKGTPSYKTLVESYQALQSLIQGLYEAKTNLHQIKDEWTKKIDNLTLSIVKESENKPEDIQEEGATLLTVLNEINTKFHDELSTQVGMKSNI